MVLIVLNNSDEEFSLKTLDKITDQEILFKIYEKNVSENISVSAVSKIKSQKVLINLIKDEESWRKSPPMLI